jgi:hypothetical protein
VENYSCILPAEDFASHKIDSQSSLMTAINNVARPPMYFPTNAKSALLRFEVGKRLRIIGRRFQRQLQGCQIFLGTRYQHGGKIYQITTKYTKCSQNIPNGHKLYIIAINRPNIFHCKALQTAIFGLKIYHLANLLC